MYLKLLISPHTCRSTTKKWWILSNFQCRTNPFKCLANLQTWECTKKTKAGWQRLIYFTALNCWADKCINLFQWVQLTMWKQLIPSLSATSWNNGSAPCQSTPPCTAQVHQAGESTKLGPNKLIYIHHWPVQEHPLNLGISGFDSPMLWTGEKAHGVLEGEWDPKTAQTALFVKSCSPPSFWTLFSSHCTNSIQPTDFQILGSHECS